VELSLRYGLSLGLFPLGFYSAAVPLRRGTASNILKPIPSYHQDTNKASGESPRGATTGEKGGVVVCSWGSASDAKIHASDGRRLSPSPILTSGHQYLGNSCSLRFLLFLTRPRSGSSVLYMREKQARQSIRLLAIIMPMKEMHARFAGLRISLTPTYWTHLQSLVARDLCCETTTGLCFGFNRCVQATYRYEFPMHMCD
jgi:hypothetical protein